MLRSDLCDFSDAYIVVKGNITVRGPDNAKRSKVLHLKIMHYFSIKSFKISIRCKKVQLILTIRLIHVFSI